MIEPWILSRKNLVEEPNLLITSMITVRLKCHKVCIGHDEAVGKKILNLDIRFTNKSKYDVFIKRTSDKTKVECVQELVCTI